MEKGISGIARQSSQGPPEFFSFLLIFHLDFVSFLKDCASLFANFLESSDIFQKLIRRIMTFGSEPTLRAWAKKF